MIHRKKDSAGVSIDTSAGIIRASISLDNYTENYVVFEANMDIPGEPDKTKLFRHAAKLPKPEPMVGQFRTMKQVYTADGGWRDWQEVEW